MSRKEHPPALLPATTVIAATLLLGACGPRAGGENPQTAPLAGSASPASEQVVIQSAPSWQEAANAVYHGVFDEPVALTEGQWQGEPFAPGGASAQRAGLVDDFLLSGDLDGDGVEEAVVLLWSSSGGSGTFDYVAVLGRDASGAAINLATAPLGDRVQVRTAAIEDRRAEFGVVQAGPEDAACCPGQKLQRSFVLGGEILKELPAKNQGRVSLEDLAGEWSLLRFDSAVTPPEDVILTLQFDVDRIVGQAACNRYTGGVREGDSPGSVALSGPLAVTRMMCEPPLMDWEQRYLAALESLTGYSFVAGKLRLSWHGDSGMGSLLFERVDGRAEEGGKAD